MAQLRHSYEKLRSLGAEVIAIGPEGPEEFKRFWDREAMPFPGLSDAGHKVADLYGQEVRLLALGRLPALFIIDREGIIRFAHRGRSMADIPSTGKVLGILEALVKSS